MSQFEINVVTNFFFHSKSSGLKKNLRLSEKFCLTQLEIDYVIHKPTANN